MFDYLFVFLSLPFFYLSSNDKSEFVQEISMAGWKQKKNNYIFKNN